MTNVVFSALASALPAWFLVRLMNVALASLVAFGLALALSGRRAWSLPFRHAILVAAMMVGLLLPAECLLLRDAGFAPFVITEVPASARRLETKGAQHNHAQVAYESTDPILGRHDASGAPRPRSRRSSASRPTKTAILPGPLPILPWRKAITRRAAHGWHFPLASSERCSREFGWRGCWPAQLGRSCAARLWLGGRGCFNPAARATSIAQPGLRPKAPDCAARSRCWSPRSYRPP